MVVQMFRTEWLILFWTIILLRLSTLTNTAHVANELQTTQPFVRLKRLVNDSQVTEITRADHEAKYGYIVGVKSYQTVQERKKTTRCTGTMMNPRMVLTTAYCVKNALRITVL